MDCLITSGLLVYTPKNITTFELALDKQLCAQNSYYQDLIEGKVLRPLEIRTVEKDGFSRYMKRIGKLGDKQGSSFDQ